MKKIILFCLVCFSAAIAIAQKETYDLVSYTAPTGWKKELHENGLQLNTGDEKKGTYAMVIIFKSVDATGTADDNFKSSWEKLVKGTVTISGEAQMMPPAKDNGWELISGMSPYTDGSSKGVAMLISATGYQKNMNAVLLTNTDTHQSDIDALVGSIELIKPDTKATQQTPSKKESNTTMQSKPSPTTNSGYKFTTTNWDDGWISTVQEDWVEVTKGSIKVLLHYPKAGTIFPADPEPLINAAWNILVAPRYSNFKNYKTAYITTYDRPYLGMSYAAENATGENVFIVFFRQGNSGWIEFVAPDKNSFIQQFKFDPETIQWDSNSDLVIPLVNMAGYNKFAVAASDLKGKWTSDFTGIQQLYNVYTGQYAGMNINQSNEEFIFNASNSYNWKLLVVNGMVGNAKFTEVKSAGQFSVPNNWQIYFSRIETGPRTFHAFWSCIKGARVLNLLDTNAPGSGIYTKYGLAK